MNPPSEAPSDFLRELLEAKITWLPSDDPCVFDALFNGEPIRLRMNDFPDYPLWTVFFLNQEVDIDDRPKSWRVVYGD